MNSVILIGRLATDVELSYTQDQTPKATFTLAVNRVKEGADFIRITVWQKQAENCNRFLAKGRQVAVHGRIQTGSYKNRNGDTVYTTDIVADNVEFLGSKEPAERPVEKPVVNTDYPETFNSVDDYVPF